MAGKVKAASLVIKEYCRDRCMNGQAYLVKDCPSSDCVLYPYRMVVKEGTAKKTRIPSIRLKCLDCSGQEQLLGDDKCQVKNCWDKECPLYPYRLGKNPNIPKGSRKGRKLPKKSSAQL